LLGGESLSVASSFYFEGINDNQGLVAILWHWK